MGYILRTNNLSHSHTHTCNSQTRTLLWALDNGQYEEMKQHITYRLLTQALKKKKEKEQKEADEAAAGSSAPGGRSSKIKAKELKEIGDNDWPVIQNLRSFPEHRRIAVLPESTPLIDDFAKGSPFIIRAKKGKSMIKDLAPWALTQTNYKWYGMVYYLKLYTYFIHFDTSCCSSFFGPFECEQASRDHRTPPLVSSRLEKKLSPSCRWKPMSLSDIFRTLANGRRTKAQHVLDWPILWILGFHAWRISRRPQCSHWVLGNGCLSHLLFSHLPLQSIVFNEPSAIVTRHLRLELTSQIPTSTKRRQTALASSHWMS